MDKIIRVDSGVYSAELPSGRQPLKATRFALIFAGEPQGHVANLRVSEIEKADLVAILHVKCHLCRKSTHNGAISSATLKLEYLYVTYKPKRADTEAYWVSSVVAEGRRNSGDARASDTRTTAEIIAAYIEGQRNDDATASLATVHYRGAETEFRAGIQLLASDDPMERAVGAEVLAQLGWQDRAFLDESVEALLTALGDLHLSVVQSAIFALGHRASPRAIPALLSFVDHVSVDLKYAVVHGLMPHDTPAVVEALSKLAADTDRGVRDWATFTLGSQFESDSPALRRALKDRLADSDSEVRSEAMVGLARRHDPGIATEVMRELESEFYGGAAIEAAGLLGDPIFLPVLRALEQRLSGEKAVLFRGDLQAAIAGCERRLLGESPTLQ